MSFDPQHLTDEIAPKLVSLLEARKTAIIEDAGGLIERTAVKMAWPTLIDEIPNITSSLIELIAWKFGDMTVLDLISALDTIKKKANTQQDLPAVQ